MSIGAIGGSNTYASTQAAGKPQDNEEMTTVTVNCKKAECEEKRAHDPSCSHSVSTKPAPKFGEKGYLLDKTA